jgi:hypothetical protein
MIAQKLRSAFLWPDRAFLAFPGNGINAYFNMDEKIFGFDPDKRHCPEDCSKTGYEVAEVSVPVEVLPVTKVGEVETDCCGEPHVSCECDPCTNTCKIVITQRIKIKIPVKIGIKTFTGESQICCVPGHCLGEEEKE